MRPLVCTLALLIMAPAASAATRGMLFPVVGGATYYDDFGEPRGQGPHEGNDLLAPKRTPVIAVEDGVVRLQHSNRGGYMLYLENARHEFLYIHLNNDRRGDDGRGGSATAYARGLRSGMHVVAGQEIGYVGDSGDAEDVVPHLHFEYHTAKGRVLDPYRQLRRAPIVAFSWLDRAPVAPVLRGVLAATAAAGDGELWLAIRLRSVQIAHHRAVAMRRLVVLRVPAAASRGVAAARRGARVWVSTLPLPVSVLAQLMRPGVFTARAVAIVR